MHANAHGMTHLATVVVVGTGTDVGKTHVTAALLRAAREQGRRVLGYKPVATGCTTSCEDAERHAEAAGAPVIPPSFTYARPVSPHLAAREEGRPVRIETIVARAAELASAAGGLVLETAGGLFSPLSEQATNADLCRALPGAKLLLVAPDRLGVLHDVKATLLAATALGLPIDALVLSAPAEPDAATGTHAAELAAVGSFQVAAVFPRRPFDAAESLAAAARTWAALPAR